MSSRVSQLLNSKNESKSTTWRKRNPVKTREINRRYRLKNKELTNQKQRENRLLAIKKGFCPVCQYIKIKDNFTICLKCRERQRRYYNNRSTK